jgi:hypothetical protein
VSLPSNMQCCPRGSILTLPTHLPDHLTLWPVRLPHVSCTLWFGRELLASEADIDAETCDHRNSLSVAAENGQCSLWQDTLHDSQRMNGETTESQMPASISQEASCQEGPAALRVPCYPTVTRLRRI